MELHNAPHNQNCSCNTEVMVGNFVSVVSISQAVGTEVHNGSDIEVSRVWALVGFLLASCPRNT